MTFLISKRKKLARRILANPTFQVHVNLPECLSDLTIEKIPAVSSLSHHMLGK